LKAVLQEKTRLNDKLRGVGKQKNRRRAEGNALELRLRKQQETLNQLQQLLHKAELVEQGDGRGKNRAKRNQELAKVEVFLQQRAEEYKATNLPNTLKATLGDTLESVIRHKQVVLLEEAQIQLAISAASDKQALAATLTDIQTDMQQVEGQGKPDKERWLAAKYSTLCSEMDVLAEVTTMKKQAVEEVMTDMQSKSMNEPCVLVSPLSEQFLT